MNYKNKSLLYIKQSKKDEIEFYHEDQKDTSALEKAYDLTHIILEKRFSNELKQYNNDESKAYDQFIFKKNLDYLRIYIEEFVLLDKNDEQLEYYKAVRYHMRNLLNCLHNEIL